MANRRGGDVLFTPHKLIRHGQLLLCYASVDGPFGKHDGTLLVDTGSNYTVLSVEILERIGCSPAASREHILILTGSGVLVAPRVRAIALTIFNRRIDAADLIAHDLPFSGPIDGLLGMDVLSALRARIDVGKAEIEMD